MTRKASMAALLFVTLTLAAAQAARAASAQALQHLVGKPHRMVLAPDTARLSPFLTTIVAGDLVTFENGNPADYTLVSDDVIDDAVPRGAQVPLAGTGGNGGAPGRLSIRFGRPGTWLFYGSGEPGAPVIGIVNVTARRHG